MKNVKNLIISRVREKIEKFKKKNWKEIFSFSNVQAKFLKIFTYDCVIFILYLLTIELLFKALTGTLEWNYTLLRIFISSSFVSVLFFSLVEQIPSSKVRKSVIIFFTLLIGIYSLAQLGFNNFLGNYMSLNTSSQLGKVTSYIMDYLHSFKANYYLLCLPMLFVIFYTLFVKHEPKKYALKPTLVLLFVLAVLYLPTLSLEFMQNKFQYVKNTTLFNNPALPNVAVNQFGISMFGILDVKSKLLGQASDLSETRDESQDDFSKREIDDEKILEIIENETDSTMNSLNRYFFSRNVTETNEYTGRLEDKNLILIMLESVNPMMVNEEYFPTLYKIYHDGISFSNHYSPRNNCATGNNEFSALTSLYTINNVCSANVYKNNTYFESLFHLFENQGYQVSSYHNYTEQYYYRNTIHKNLGSTYFGVDELEIPYENVYKEWPSDVSLVEEAYRRLNTDEKFMALLTTVTTHQPYGVSSTYGDKYLDRFQDLDVSISVKRYLSKMVELDLALERLLELLEEDGILEDTTIVMFGDHYPYGIKTSELQKMFDYDLEQNQEIEKTPFVIYDSSLEREERKEYTTYMNILPTLANLFNLEYDPRLYMGEDLFSKDYSNIAVFTDGSWQSSYAYYDAESSRIHYIVDDFRYSDEAILAINKEINEKISMSNLAIVKNYFHYLERKLYPERVNDSVSDDEGSLSTSSK